MDPNNPNYKNELRQREDENDEDDTLYEFEDEEGFSTDAYYVPFRVNNAKTKRKPDAPFMAMFSMYANKNNKEQAMSDDDVNEKEEEEEVEQMIGNGDENIVEHNEEEQKIEDVDAGSSPPLNPQIPST